MAGELVTADWMLEYNGIAMGNDEAILLTRATGLLDLPDLDDGDQARLRRHGLHPGDDFLQGRTVTLALEIYADAGDTAAWQTAVDELLTMTKPGEDEAKLFFQVPGIAGGAKAFVWARPRKRKVTIDREYFFHMAKVLVQFDATDPRVYLAAQGAGSTEVSVSTGGFSWPQTWPISWGTTGAAGTISATNAGTFKTGAMLRIDGPCVNPRIENTTQGKTIAIDISLTASDYLLLDTEDGTVLLNGTASRYSSLTTTSQWFDLEPGANLLKYRATTATGSTLAVTWRSAYV